MKIIAVIQARMNATRLPNKMMLSLHGIPIIDWVTKRVKKSELLNDFIVAIPDTKADDILANYLQTNKINVFRGSPDDVLGRIYQAAAGFCPHFVVRVCADNPLVSPNEIDNLINFYYTNKCDYAYNHIPLNNTYPDGLGAEIFSFKLLEEIEKNAKEKSHREHCCNYIKENPDLYKIATFNPKDEAIAFPNLKLDIDTFEDYYYLSSKYFTPEIKDRDLIRLFLK